MSLDARNAWRSMAPELIGWSANVPRLLGDESKAWLVHSGAVAVFAAEVREGAPVGPRRFLFRLGEGRGFVSAPGTSEGMRLLIVPVVDSEVRELPLTRVHEEAARQPGVMRPVDEWLASIAEQLADPGAPEIEGKANGADEVTLEGGWSVRADDERVLWVDPGDASLQTLGSERPSLQLASGWRPLAPRQWATASGELRVATRSTDALPDLRSLENGIAWLHAAVLDELDLEARKRDEADRKRLLESARRQRKREDAALIELASVTTLEQEPPLRDTDLVTAVAAVGEAMGVEIQDPPRWEDPSKASDPVDAIARASRIRTRRVLLAGEWWKHDYGPLVAFREDGHEVIAVLQDRRGRYEVFDPRSRSRRRVDASVAAEIAPEAVTLYRPFPTGKLTLFGIMRFSVRGRRKDLVIALLIGVLVALLGMATPQATGWIIDKAIPDANRKLLVELSLGLTAAAFGIVVFTVSQSLVLLRVGIGSEAALQAALWDRLLRLRPSFFRQFSSGDLQQRVSTVSTVGRELNGAALSGLFSGMMALLNVFLLYYYSPKLTLLAILLVVITTGITLVSGYFIRRLARELFEEEGKFAGFVLELLQGVTKLQVAGAEGRAYTRWIRRYTTQLRLRVRMERIEDWITVYNQVLPTVGSLFLFSIAASLLLVPISGGPAPSMTVGKFMAFNGAFGTFLGAATGLSNTIVGLLDTLTKGQRIKPILEADPETDDDKVDPGALTGRIEFRDVEFRYRDDGPLILDGVSLRAEPGEFIAIVGSSGSGKSTLVRLLLGFETPASGSILLDGQDLATVDVAAVRRQFGVVLQGGVLNQGSIFENISGGLAVPMDDAQEAAEAAGFAEDLASMPMGMHTVVSEGGGNLSGGQRQRLLIARALVSRPKVLVFDEATSALDNRTQQVVSESLEARKVTRVVIAHRLSTIRNADRIYVLDQGRVVESGGFDELLETDGMFSRMMKRQMT